MTVAVTRLDLSARDLRASAARSTDAKAARQDVGDCVGYGRVGPARRRRGAAGWTGKPCATGCIVTMPGGLRACRTARHQGARLT